MSTENKTAGTTWTLVATAADSVLITAITGYGDICQYAGTPPESLRGHPIAAGRERNSAYTVTGDIYARAAAGSNQMLLAITA